jgi:hypothetical protein
MDATASDFTQMGVTPTSLNLADELGQMTVFTSGDRHIIFVFKTLDQKHHDTHGK